MNLKLTLSLVALATLLGCKTTDSIHSEAEHSNGQVSVKSPDGAIEFILRESRPLTYSVSVDGRPVLSESRLGLKFKGGLTLGADARLVKVHRKQSNTTRENKLGKRRIVSDRHQELRAKFLEQSGRSFEIVVRVFNDGLGFRYVLPEVPSGETSSAQADSIKTRAKIVANRTNCFLM